MLNILEVGDDTNFTADSEPGRDSYYAVLLPRIDIIL